MGHGATAPVGVKGLVWAVNTYPYKEYGQLLWRPRPQMATENEDWASLFDPDTERFIHAACVQDGMMCLITSDTASKVVWWKPGSAPQTVVSGLPVPEDDIGMVAMAGTDAIIAIEGDGLTVIEWGGGSWTDHYKIGAGFVGYAGGGNGATLTDSATIMSVTSGKKAFIHTVTVFAMVENAEEKAEIKFTLKVGGQEALETYSSDYVTQQAGGVMLYTPLTFTFNKAFSPPFDIELVFKEGSGDRELYLEANSKYDTYHQWTVSGYSLHIHVGGTMSPDGGVVTTNRGGVIAKAKSNFIQLCDIGQWSFEEEVTIDGVIMGMASVSSSLVIATRGGLYSADGWSYSGINIRRVYDYGISHPRQMMEVAQGAMVYIIGKPVYLSPQGVQETDFPFFYEVDGDTWVTYLPRHMMVLISVDGFNKVCAYGVVNKAAVWWQFQELDNAIPVGCCKDVLVFNNGKAYYMGYDDDPNWDGYSIELAFSSGELGEGEQVAMHKIAFDGPILNHASSAQATVHIASVSPYNIHVSAVDIERPKVPDGFELPNWLSIDTNGVYGMIPEDSDGGFFLLFPNYHEPLQTTVVSETESDEGLLPTGNAFIFGLTLDETVIKHPGALLKQLIVYVESAGESLQ